MSDEPRKRSRFDQTEPEPRRSRFDRRSRSPSSRKPASRRSRSPLDRDLKSPPSSGTPTEKKKDPAAAAAEAAARINAQLQARKGIQHVDVPPIRSTASPATATSPDPKSNGAAEEVYTQDGDYIRDVEINDLRNRYTLTKGQTQKMIKEETGADVTTRGEYLPDKTMATAAKPPLYLHITSTTKEGLEKAIAKIDDLMKVDLPNLVDERRFRRREPEPFERDELGRRKWPEERIPIDLEPIPGFNLRAQVVGHGGTYVKHIQQESGCRVQIKGRGSGYTERDTGLETDEPMFLHVAGPDPNQVQRGKELCEDLIANVKQQYESFKERGPSHDRYGSHHGGGHGPSRYGERDRDRSASHGGGYSGGYGSQQSPPAAHPMSPAPGTPGPASSGQPDYSQYAQYYAAGANGQDPYAAYGGYQNYVAWYTYYQQAQAQGQGAPGAPYQQSSSPPPGPPGTGTGSPAPPPPPTEAPPPPPSGPPGAGSYSNVPPPPGL